MELLPQEVICKILGYLDFHDRRQMALINTKWHYASLHPRFQRTEIFVLLDDFVYSSYCDNYPAKMNYFAHFKNTLFNSKRKVFQLRISGVVAISNSYVILKKLGEKIISLEITCANIIDDSHFDAISNCRNLQQLTFKGIYCLKINDKPRSPLLSLLYLEFLEVDLYDRDFNIIMKLAPNLKYLGISENKPVSWSQCIRRFYPQNTTNYNSDLIFTKTNIQHHLKVIKSLNHVFTNVKNPLPVIKRLDNAKFGVGEVYGGVMKLRD